MKAHLIHTHLLVPRSRASAKVKVKYQVMFLKRWVCFRGISVSQTHLVRGIPSVFMSVCISLFKIFSNFVLQTPPIVLLLLYLDFVDTFTCIEVVQDAVFNHLHFMV